MKKILLLIIVTVCCSVMLHAQTNSKPWTQNDSLLQYRNFKKNKLFADSLLRQLQKNLKGNAIVPPGSMPKKFYYLGNNGAGFDIYQTPQDNMFILKPDSTFSSHMPNAGKLVQQYSSANRSDSLQKR